MLEAIEKLLILQDRDRRIIRLQAELDHIEPERQALQAKAQNTQKHLDAARLRVKELESKRKDLELQVDSRKQQIDKYSIQQFQTKKNEEYRALGNEIATCKAAIVKLDDQQLELMEQGEAAQKEVVSATRAANEAKKLVEDQLVQLAAREKNLTRELEELRANRQELAGAVDEGIRSRYERLLKNKGDNVVVGIQHGVCGGCHMRIPAQIILACRREQELVTCTNCARILYYTRDMDLALVD